MVAVNGDAMNVVSLHILRIPTSFAERMYNLAHTLADNEIRGFASYPIDAITGRITTPHVDSSLYPLYMKSAHQQVLFGSPAFPSAH
jgi:hypothetical protein